MARRRDYAAEHARRVEIARAKGYGRSGLNPQYERRTRAAPGGVKPPPAELAQRRGHARDSLLAALRDSPPRLLVLGRDHDGERWGELLFFVRTQDDDELEFRLRDVDEARIDELRAAIDKGGGPDVITVVGSPAALVQALSS